LASALRTLPLVLHARDRPTRRGRWFGVAAIAFGPLWLWGADALLDVAGMPWPASPFWLRVAFYVTAVLPVLWYIGAHLRPTFGRALGWLEPVPAKATIDASGIALVMEGAPPQVVPWSAIGALTRSGGTWRFFGLDGAVLATIPRELAYPRFSLFDDPTLAEAIVQVRPDRYVLRGGHFLRSHAATEFGLR
jgi:hypothetical protein